MTIASDIAKSGPYSGDGSTVTFAVAFYFLANADLLVTRRNGDGSETVLTLGVDYSVSGAGNPAGGSITCAAAPALTATITITRNMARIQGLDLPNGGVFSADALEKWLDYLTMEIQQLNEKQNRQPALQISSLSSAPVLDDPVASRALVYSADGARIASGPPVADIASAQAYAASAAASAAVAVAAAGYKYLYSSSTAAADPGAGVFRSDNAALTLATKLYISKTTGGGQGIGADIGTWDDQTSVSRGRIRIFRQSDPSVFSLFGVTGSNTDNGAWDTVNVTYICGNGALANNDIVTLEFFQSGDKGDTGATGPAGPSGTLPVADAGGTADAITAAYSPALSLADKTVCMVVPSADNTVSAPTFAPDGLTAHAITKNGGGVLVAGDIKALRPAILEYNLSNTRWDLINPVFSPPQTGDVVTAGAAATIQPQSVTFAKMQNISASARVMGRRSTGAGAPEECTLSQVLDFIGSAAQGDILFRDVSGWARLPAGTAGQFLKTQGAAANPLWAPAAGAIDIQSFTGNGTWTKPSTGTWALVRAWGGGGSGASSTNTTNFGGGGGGGGYKEAWFSLASLGTTETITIGAGGAAIAGTLTAGNDGGNATFGAWLTAFGGAGAPLPSGASSGGGGGGQFSKGSGSTGGTPGAGGPAANGENGPSTSASGGTNSVFGGAGGGGSSGTFGPGGWSVNGGAGGGSSNSGSSAGASGGNSTNGGGGGGGATNTGTRGSGGTSVIGGNGGQGGNASNNGVDGVQPAGGGGGACNGKTSGKGGDGKIVVMVF